jgi:hypothetical protein
VIATALRPIDASSFSGLGRRPRTPCFSGLRPLAARPIGKVGLHRILLLAIAGSLLGSLVGCGAAEDPHVVAQRKRLVLAEEPSGATSIADAQKNLAAQPEVTLVGCIGAPDQQAFEQGRASFVLSEAPASGHHHASGHDADNCPFCRHRAAEARLAVVQFVDERGEILKTDAPTLLGVESGQVVVVRGHGELNEKLDLLVVTAGGIHIRK